MSTDIPLSGITEPTKKVIPSGMRNARRRIFGILADGESLENIGLFGKMAYRAQSGIHYLEKSPQKLLDGMKSQLFGGRSLEVLVCEGLIARGGGFHFLPPKELDVTYKIDMCSRRPYRDTNGALRTFCIGTQLTVAEIPENLGQEKYKGIVNLLKYQQKFEQIQAITPFLHNPITRKEIKETFGKLTLPDVICYIAVNGELRKKLGQNTSGYTYMKYNEWKSAGFDTQTLAERFKSPIQGALDTVVDFIDWSQLFIYSRYFIEEVWKKGRGSDVNFVFENGYKIDYSASGNNLTFILDNERGEVLCKITYFFYSDEHVDDIEKISHKI